MQKVLRVLVVIGIVVSLVQICSLIVDLTTPGTGSESWRSEFAKQALHAWRIYWPSGLAILLAGIVTRRLAALVGDSLLIGGAYLMLLGNSGGIWAGGYESWRLASSVVTLLIFILSALRTDKLRAS